MRYLYGDSVPFPPQYDFLAALEVFCAQAARVVRLESEARGIQGNNEQAAVARGRAVEELETFHREAVGALRDGAKETTQPLVRDYVAAVTDVAQKMVDEARRLALLTSDKELQAARGECERRRGEAREALEKLLTAIRLPVRETHITMALEGGHNELAGVFTHEGGLVASFTLAGQEVDEWKAPRHVRDLATQVTLPVGVKRSLFKRTVAPETISLDEYVLGGFSLHDDHAQLRLRRKVDAADSLVFDVRQNEDRLVAEVHYPDDAEAESGLPAVLDQASAQEVQRLWQQLRSGCGPLLSHKKRLVNLRLDGEDVSENDLGTKVVALVVKAIASTVAEVARRSPNAHELSLKVENDTGRREEIYLRKAQLVSSLSSVEPVERTVFDPLGLIASGPRDPLDSLQDEAIQPG
jgi:hypothetical protein